MVKNVNWFIRWLFLSLSTAGGWLIAWFVSMSMGFASAIWDPDEVDAYLRLSPWQHVFDALVVGAMVGAMVGVVIAIAVALAQVALRRKARDVVVTVAAVILGSALLCGIVQVGPIQTNESGFLAMFRIGFGGGAVGGAIAGWGQWLLLHRQMTRMSGWVLGVVLSWAVAFGLMLGWTTADQLHTQAPVYAQVLVTILSGAVAGLGPTWVLRRNVSRAIWFIPASAIAWGAGSLHLTAQGYFFLAPPILLGALTAGALVALLYFRTRSSGSLTNASTSNSGSESS